MIHKSQKYLYGYDFMFLQTGSVPANSALVDLIVNANDISEYIYFADIVANYIEEQMNNTKTILENFHI